MDPTQTGGGLSFPNALGIAFSQSQVRGAPSGGGTDVFSTVTLLLNGNLISAEPGDSSVNIGASITGQNVQYISQMAGTTMINSPTMVNGNLVLPHQYNFSMNPEQSAGVPTATINADVNIGTPTLNPDVILYPSVFNVATGDSVFSGDSLAATCPTIGFTASNITFTTSSITTTASSITVNTPTATTNTTTAQTNTTVYVLSSQTAYISSDQNLSISTNSGSINMNAASNVNINSSGSNVNIESYYITNVKGSDVNVVADSGLSLFNTPIVNVKAGPGGPLGGRVNIDAFASYGEVAGYGLVSINAYGSTNNPAVPIGGSVEVNAFSASAGSYGGATSAIRLNAATINLNAGAIPPFLSLAGSMTMFGNNIVSICAGLPAVFPQIPLTTYIYGFAGLRLDCGTGARITTLGILQAPDIEVDMIAANGSSNQGVYFRDPITANVITPQPSPLFPNGGGDLIIRGSNLLFNNSYVQLQDVGSIAFATAYNTSNVTGAITGLSTINGQGVGAFGGSSWSLYNQVSSLSSITADSGFISSLTVSSFNGTPFAPWYDVPAAGPVEMNENSINNASYIITSNFYTTELNGQYTGTDMGKLTMKASTLSIIASTISMLNLSTINGNSYIDTRSWATVPATVGIDANGHNVGNVGTIFANDVVVGNSIVFTNPDGIININDNALINVSSIQASPGNAISFANAGLINVSTINGYPLNSIVNSWISTATTDLDMNNFNIVNTYTMTVNVLLASLVTMDNLSTAGITCFGDINVNSNSILNVSSIQPSVSSVISFGNAGLTNVSSINGYAVNTFANTWISTATTQLDMNNFNIVNTDKMTANTFLASLLTADNISTGSLTCFGNMNMDLGNIYSTNIITAVGGAVRTQMDTGGFYGNGVTAVSYVTTPSITGLSSINGAAYPPAASWNGNATTNLNMNLNNIINATNVGVVNLTANTLITSLTAITTPLYNGTNMNLSGTITTPGVAMSPTNITVGATTLDGGGLAATGITVSYANISGNVNSLCPIFAQPNYYLTSAAGNYYYLAPTPGTYNVKCTNAPPSTGISFQIQVNYSTGQPGVYRVVNQTNASGGTPGDNMMVQFTTIDSGNNYWNWNQNTQLNPGESLRAVCWFCGGQNRFVFTDFLKEGNPTPSN